MKLNRLFTTVLVVAAVVLLAASCTKQDVREVDTAVSNKPIEVRSYSVGGGTQLPTKAAIYGSTMPTDRDLVISAYYNAADDAQAGAGVVAGGEGLNSNFFKNYLFSYSSEKQTWTSAEKPVYWPLKGTLDFLAYSSEDAQISAQWNADNCASEVVLGSFKESLGLSDDLLYAKANNQTYSTSGVPMEFRHAKSLIVFTAKSSNADAITITKIEINGLEQIDNAKTQLTITNIGEEPASAEWNKEYKAAEDVTVPGIDNISYNVPVKAMDVTKKSSYLGIGGQGIMVPEQEMKSFTVYFEQNGADGNTIKESFTYDCKIGEAEDTEWKMGKRYIYELNFKVNEIEVSPVVVPWDENAEEGDENPENGSGNITEVDIPEAATIKVSSKGEYALPNLTLDPNTKLIIDWGDGSLPEEFTNDYSYGSETTSTAATKGAASDISTITATSATETAGTVTTPTTEAEQITGKTHTYTGTAPFFVKFYVSEKGHVDMGRIKEADAKDITVKIEERVSLETYDPTEYIQFEDPLFKAYCVDNFDKNKDGEISLEEAEPVLKMDFCANGISSINEIKYFLNLEDLRCSMSVAYTKKDAAGVIHFYDGYGNEVFGISSLDVSNNLALRILYCTYNPLKVLDVSKNINLTVLGCSSNQLTDIDVSNNTMLTLLRCSGNELTDIDVSNNPLLTQLECGGNLLQTIDVSNNLELDYFACNNNLLSNLDLSQNAKVKTIYCRENQLESLNLEGADMLTHLECQDNLLTSLDASKNAELSYLVCNDNLLEELKLEGIESLGYLVCHKNKLTSLDVSDNVNLTTIDCSYNQLASLDISKNVRLYEFSCNGNSIKNLDVTNNTRLTGLLCSSNQLTVLDVSKNAILKRLWFGNNKISEIDLSNNVSLASLQCQNNLLTEIDLSKNVSLAGLDCSSNKLVDLDLSNNTKLSVLECHSNQLTSLDVSNNLSMSLLECSPMSTLEILYLAQGQEIPQLKKPNKTVIEYK